MADFPLPRRLYKASGEVRRVGVELEFAGVELDRTCELIQELFGGRQEPLSRFETRVVDTRFGEFGVEIDMLLLKERSYMKFLDFMGVELDEASLRQAEETLARIAATLVPYEVTTPPLPMTEAHQLEALRARLQQEHALGTKASLRYAFGLQFNPEIPAFEGPLVLAYLRAFLLLSDWLRARTQVALARRLSPFINEFPQDYARRVLDPAYPSELGRVIDDYVTSNPTRNRPLDLMPLFAHLEPERVARALDDVRFKNKPRPTFHYRLPNCLIDDPGWTLAQEWAGWVAVDDLAQAPERIAAMSEDYLAERSQWTLGYDAEWAERVERKWLPGL